MIISEFYFFIKNNDYFLSFKIKLIRITVPDIGQFLYLSLCWFLPFKKNQIPF